MRQVVIGKIALAILFLSLGFLRLRLQEDAMILDKQLEFGDLLQGFCRHQIVAGDFEPLVDQWVEFDEAIAAAQNFQPEISALQHRLLGDEVYQGGNSAGFAFHTPVIAEKTERQEGNGQDGADDDQDDEDLDERKARGVCGL
jgi:hypothetical protein